MATASAGTSADTRQSDCSGKRQAGDEDRRGPGSTEGLVPALVTGLNAGAPAAQRGLPSWRRQQHPERMPRPRSPRRAVPHTAPSVSQPKHPPLCSSTAPFHSAAGPGGQAGDGGAPCPALAGVSHGSWRASLSPLGGRSACPLPARAAWARHRCTAAAPTQGSRARF